MNTFLKGLGASILAVIVFSAIDYYFFNIPDFIKGWFCCMVYYWAVKT